MATRFHGPAAILLRLLPVPPFFSLRTAAQPASIIRRRPQAVYQTERWWNSTYIFGNLVPLANYSIRLLFAEISPSMAGPGDRQFNVAIKGRQVLTNFDVFANVGAKYRASIRQFTTYSDP